MKLPSLGRAERLEQLRLGSGTHLTQPLQLGAALDDGAAERLWELSARWLETAKLG